jgi:hypothetical protein
MFGTLYSALIMHSYLMSLVCCALQVCFCVLECPSPCCHDIIKAILLLPFYSLLHGMHHLMQAKRLS